MRRFLDHTGASLDVCFPVAKREVAELDLGEGRLGQPALPVALRRRTPVFSPITGVVLEVPPLLGTTVGLVLAPPQGSRFSSRFLLDPVFSPRVAAGQTAQRGQPLGEVEGSLFLSAGVPPNFVPAETLLRDAELMEDPAALQGPGTATLLLVGLLVGGGLYYAARRR